MRIENRTDILREFCEERPDTHYYSCDRTTTVKDVLRFMARSIGVRVVDDKYQMQVDIQNAMGSSYCFVFDDAEKLMRTRPDALDTIRQIHDQTGAPIVLAGSRSLEKAITRKHSKLVWRLRKVELDPIRATA